MSTIIKHKEFTNHKVYKTEVAGRPLTIDVGKVAELATASAMVTYGETTVLVAVTVSPRPRDGVDFFPLSVDFEEKLYAVGRIPGSFMRREGQPSLPAVLASRVIDRSIRPLFPYDFRNDVVVTATVMSVDRDCSPEVTAMIGVSACLAYSCIPWAGPIGCLEVGYVDGQIVLNPTNEQKHASQLDLTVAATDKKVIMIEAGAKELPDDIMYDAIVAAHEDIKKQVAFINQIVAEIGRDKMTYDHADFDQELFDKIVEATHGRGQRRHGHRRQERREEAGGTSIIEQWHELYPGGLSGDGQVPGGVHLQVPEEDRQGLAAGGPPGGRPPKNEIRPLAAEVGVLPRVHGSGLFTRGQTQVLSVCTLDTLSADQKLDTIWEEEEKRYMHHYNFPAYSTGEAQAARSTSRREIGHGALAERALEPVIPSVEDFPYAIRVVSEVLSSNGSTSQGSICGSTLALMDAGVPITAPVAGISCGLIQDDDGGFTTFIDIQGVEDFHGEMDFKVAGTKKRYHRHPDGHQERRPDHGDHQGGPGHHQRRPLCESWTRSCCPASPSPAPRWPTPPQDGEDEDRPWPRSARSSAPAARSSRRSWPTPAPRSTSTTTAPSSSPAWTPPAATPPRSALTTSCSSRRWARCTTAAWCG